MFIVYILYSISLDKYYIGYTADIESRLQKHNAKHHGFTGKTTDWIVQYKETYSTKSAATKRERELKAWKSRIKIEQLIRPESSIE